MDITFIVGGSEYKISREVIVNGPDSKLKEIVLTESGTSTFTFDRPKTYFKAIFAYHQTGNLHLPICVCPVAFKEELEFWGITYVELKKCCYMRFKNFFDDQKKLEGFSESLITEEEILDKKRRTGTCGRLFSRIWNVLENRDESLLTKMYFAISILFVLTAVMSIAVSTIPSVKFYSEENSTNNLIPETTSEADSSTWFSSSTSVPITSKPVTNCTLNQQLVVKCKRCFRSKLFFNHIDEIECKNDMKLLKEVCYQNYIDREILQKVLCKWQNIDFIEFCKLCYTTKFITFPDSDKTSKCEFLMAQTKHSCYTDFMNTKNTTNDLSTGSETAMQHLTHLTREGKGSAEFSTTSTILSETSSRTACTLNEELMTKCRHCFYPKPDFATDHQSCYQHQLYVQNQCFKDYIINANVNLPLCKLSEDPINCKLCYTTEFIPFTNQTKRLECVSEMNKLSSVCYDNVTEEKESFSKVTPIIKNEFSTSYPSRNISTSISTDGPYYDIDEYITCTLCLLDHLQFTQFADTVTCTKDINTFLNYCFGETLSHINTRNKVLANCSVEECKRCFLDPPSFRFAIAPSKCAFISKASVTFCYQEFTASKRNVSLIPSELVTKEITTADTEYLSPSDSPLGQESSTTEHLGSRNGTDQNRTSVQIPKKNFIPVFFQESGKEKFATISNIISKELYVFLYIEYAVNVFFIIELILRFITCPSWKYFFKSILNFIEILVFVSCCGRYFSYHLGLDDQDILLYLQMIRVLRLLRVTENLSAFKVLTYSIKKATKDLLLTSMYIFIATMIFSNFIYFFEKNADFPSIPDAWWWCIVTMTTVGYGDMYPKTVIGRIIGAICACTGVVIFSMIIPIFVQTFLSVYQYMSLMQTDVKLIRDRDMSFKNSKDSETELHDIKVAIVEKK